MTFGDVTASQKTAQTDSMTWIPGGDFLMGSDRHYVEEAPAHRVIVDGFWMDTARCWCPKRSGWRELIIGRVLAELRQRA